MATVGRMVTTARSIARSLWRRRPPAAPRKRTLGDRHARRDAWLIGGASVMGFLVLWQVLADTGTIPRLLFSSPIRIVAEFGRLIETGELQRNLAVSSLEFVVGFGGAVAIGIPFGMAAGLSARLGRIAEPFLAALYATPTIALVPLLVIWFGIGLWDKVAIVFLAAFFQVAIATMAGVHLVDARLVRVARSYGASRSRLIRTILVPSSVPFILLGLKLGVGRALVGVVVAEFFASRAGIGFMIAQAGAQFQTAKVLAGILLVAALGVGFTALLGYAEKRFQSWRPAVVGT